MQTKTINNLEELFQLLTAQYFSLFRGLSNSSYHLETSLARNGGDELSILRNFSKYAALEGASIWKQMVIGQHHGLPTRLLDWSHSPLVALYFATNERNPEDIHKHDCAVWQIKAQEVNSLLPIRYKAMLHKDALFFTLKQLKNKHIKLRQIDEDQAVILLEPPAIDARIINQFSFFSVVPHSLNMETFLESTSNTIKYIISKHIRHEIRNMLDKLNISERTMLLGLDGMCMQLNRFYKVSKQITSEA